MYRKSIASVDPYAGPRPSLTGLSLDDFNFLFTYDVIERSKANQPKAMTVAQSLHLDYLFHRQVSAQ